VKIQGNRVELEEIEMHLREVSGVDLVAAVPWPQLDGLAAGVVGFAAAPDADAPELQKAVAARLPSYMVPSCIHLMTELPLNGNGKVDRKALLAWLDAEAA
jgi:acyl-CoA synthetase (AMP-forming)/AMP-acid ligase II